MKKNEKFIIVIFGASGDLTKRKLIPALYNLVHAKHLSPDQFLILGVSRTSYTDQEFRHHVFADSNYENGNKGEMDSEIFAGRIFYLPLETKDPGKYQILKNRLTELDDEYGFPGNYLFYLSTPPSMFGTIATGLSTHGLNMESDDTFKRLIIEKPFGYDLMSSRKLNSSLHKCFNEEQIFRIDHYLGKETVQNLLVTRFSNSIFEPLWNRNYIHHIEITAAEEDGVGSRGGYYESSGALRDMIQNHLFNLLALVAMEPPVNLEAEAIRNETSKVFQSVRRLTKSDIVKNVIRGQYTASRIGNKYLRGYREEDHVNPGSSTETYAALKIFIDNWRWAGVPFYIRSGKRMPKRVTEIVVHFKSTPHYLYPGSQDIMDKSNLLVFRIQPGEGILLKFGIKTPGSGFRIKSVNMDFHYADHTEIHLPEAYERLLLDAVHGDATLYPRNDSVEEAWKIVDPILKEWKSNPQIKLYGYPAGTWGPENTDDLIEGEDSTWRYPCKNLKGDGIYCEL